MKKVFCIIFITSLFLAGCTAMQTTARVGSERQLRAATERYFGYVGMDQFNKILEMTVPESEYYRRLSSQMNQMKMELATGEKKLEHEFEIKEMFIDGIYGTVSGEDKITGHVVKNGTDMPVDMSVDFVLKFEWINSQWLLVTTE